jgi:hypothetical protein
LYDLVFKYTSKQHAGAKALFSALYWPYLLFYGTIIAIIVMTIAFRRTVFYSLVIVFFILGSGFVFYSQGYRLDFRDWRVTKVGALYVASYPKDASIYIDDRSVKNESWLLKHGTFINDLFPKTYLLALSAPEYKDWQRTVTIAPSLVTEIKNAILIPVRAQQASALSDISHFWVLPNGVLAIQSATSTLTIGSSTMPVASTLLGHTVDGSSLLVRQKKTGAYVWVDRVTNTSFALSIGGSSASNPFFVVDSFANNSLLLADSSGIATVNPRTNEKRVIASLTPAVSNTIIRSTITPTATSVIWAQYDSKKKSSTVRIFDKHSFMTTSLEPLPGKTQSIASAPNGMLAVIQEDTGATFLIHPDTGAAELVAPASRLASFSPDGRSLALLVSDGIHVISLDDREPDSYVPLPESTDITGFIWHKGSGHLLVIYPQVIRLLDVSDTTLQEFDDVLTGTLFRYDPTTNTVYGLNNGTLMKIVLPG